MNTESDEDEDNAQEWDGIADEPVQTVDHEAEYIDEDKYTTVTVEEVDISREGISKLGGNEEDNIEHDGESAATRVIDSIPKKSPRRKDKDSRPKKKKKNFRYESPADRKLNRAKVKAKNSKQARIRRGA